jgi:hypothetical protein
LEENDINIDKLYGWVLYTKNTFYLFKY